MIAYNKTYLQNRAILKKAKYWFAKKLLSAEQFNSITTNYKSNLYNPSIFIKIGQFIFTHILISAAISFYSIFLFSFSNNFDSGFGVFTCLLFSGACFFALEQLIKGKNLYNSGIDEALLYTALGFFIGALVFLFKDIFDNENTVLFYCLLLIPVFSIAAIRYTDKFIALLLAACIYATFFLLVMKFGEIAKMIMPFALMLFSALIYFQAKKYKAKEELFLWKGCITVFECLGLLVFYLACNYYVIRESSIAFFDMNLAPGEDIPIAIVFYILTALVPIAYVYYGLKNKDKILIWIGLVLIAAAAFTFKYYFSMGHPEITLTLAGSIMIIIAYLSIKYLKTPKHGITFEEEKDEDSFLKSNAEALIIAQSFSQQGQNQSSSDSNPGGGDFGGAGAGTKF